MALNPATAAETQNRPGLASGASPQELDRQRLRILRCTAQAMASSPGGLRFRAGTRPWLEGIPGGSPVSSRPNRQRGQASARPAAN
ncbi:MAG: hypothetical protein JWR60_2426 [Polaromonas sp.]|nr:hypothetical protein [Polaromonas sp.]